MGIFGNYFGGGNRFPYTNFHDLNMDWIIAEMIKFIKQYNTIEETLDNVTTADLQRLADKYTELEGLLTQWYNSHSDDIETELDSALSEIETFTNTVISEIPQEYSELSSNITALKNNLFSIRNLLKAEDLFTVYGKCLISNGVEYNSAGHVATDYIRLNAGDTVEYNLAGSDNSVIVFCEYTLLKAFRNTIAVGAGVSTAVTGTYTAPADVYIRMCCRKEYPATVKINNGATFTTNTEKAISENLGFAKGLRDINDLLNLENYCIRASNGELVSSTNYYYSDFIRLETGDKIKYSLRGSDNSIAVLAIYNQNHEWLKTIAVGIQYQTDVTGEYVAEFECYARFCNRKDNPNGYITFDNGLTHAITSYVDNHVDFPDYWRDTIENKINLYNTKNALVGKNGLSFAFISDTHWSANAKHSPELLNYIANHTNLDTIVHGGDHVVSSLENIRNFVNKIEKPVNYIPCVGNHEFDGNLAFTDNEIWSCGFKRSESLYKYNNGFNYCYDNEFQKVRFIVLNYADPNVVTYFTTHASELPTGWKIIVICHEYWTKETPSSSLQVTTVGASIANAITTNYNVWDAKVILYLVGHIHFDNSTILSCGVPIVSINCDAYTNGQSYDWGGYQMTLGTTTEQCFDLINIDFNNNKAYFTRV